MCREVLVKEKRSPGVSAYCMIWQSTSSGRSSRAMAAISDPEILMVWRECQDLRFQRLYSRLGVSLELVGESGG